MPYYRDTVNDIESIRSTLKHVDPEKIDLADIRDRLGPIVADLEVLMSLRRPHSYKLTWMEDGLVEIEIKMQLDQGTADDMVRKLWLEA